MRIGHRPRARDSPSSSTEAELELPCGRCIGCRLDRARAWSIRIGHEAQLWKSNRFVTLDYAPEKLKSWSLRYGDFQAFMKALRKVVPPPIRFFVAGEYGARYMRPHFHAILFNLRLDDEVRYANGTTRSDLLESVWNRGHCVIGDVNARSAAYVAGYTLGKVAREQLEDVVDVKTGELTERKREFVHMSNRPGIGALWYEKYKWDLFSTDRAFQDGKYYKVPRYYWERFKAGVEGPGGDFDRVVQIQEERIKRAELIPAEENSPERRRDKEELAYRKREFYSSAREH